MTGECTRCGQLFLLALAPAEALVVFRRLKAFGQKVAMPLCAGCAGELLAQLRREHSRPRRGVPKRTP